MDNKRTKLVMADGGIVFVLAVFIPLAISLALSLIMLSAPSFLAGPERYWVLAAITQVIMLGCTVGYAAVKKIDLLSACAMKTKIKPWQIAACVGLGLSLLCFMLPPQTWLNDVITRAELAKNTSAGPDLSNGWFLVLALLLPGTASVFFEELVFRGYICGSLAKSEHGIEWGAAAASAFLFAVMHQNPRQTLYPLVLGFVMAVVYFSTRSLWASVIIHFTNNTAVLLLSYFCPQFEGFVMANWAWIMPVALVVIVPLVWLFVKTAGKRQVEAQPAAEDGQISPQRAARNKALPFYAAGTVCCIVIWFMMLAS